MSRHNSPVALVYRPARFCILGLKGHLGGSGEVVYWNSCLYGMLSKSCGTQEGWSVTEGDSSHLRVIVDNGTWTPPWCVPDSHSTFISSQLDGLGGEAQAMPTLGYRMPPLPRL